MPSTRDYALPIWLALRLFGLNQAKTRQEQVVLHGESDC